MLNEQCEPYPYTNICRSDKTLRKKNLKIQTSWLKQIKKSVNSCIVGLTYVTDSLFSFLALTVTLSVHQRTTYDKLFSLRKEQQNNSSEQNSCYFFLSASYYAFPVLEFCVSHTFQFTSLYYQPSCLSHFSFCIYIFFVYVDNISIIS